MKIKPLSIEDLTNISQQNVKSRFKSGRKIIIGDHKLSFNQIYQQLETLSKNKDKVLSITDKDKVLSILATVIQLDLDTKNKNPLTQIANAFFNREKTIQSIIQHIDSNDKRASMIKKIYHVGKANPALATLCKKLEFDLLNRTKVDQNTLKMTPLEEQLTVDSKREWLNLCENLFSSSASNPDEQTLIAYHAAIPFYKNNRFNIQLGVPIALLQAWYHLKIINRPY